MTTTFVIGQRCPVAVPEGVSLHIEGLMAYVFMGVPAPTAREVQGAKKGRVELRVLGSDVGLLLLLQVVPGFPWCDAPYEWWRATERVPVDDDAPRVSQFVLVLVDTDTQRLRVVRAFPVRLDVLDALYASLRAQASRAEAPSRAEADAWFASMMAHPTAALAAMAAGAAPGDADA